MHLGSKLLETDNQSQGELETDPDSQTDLTVETNQGIDVCYVYEYKLCSLASQSGKSECPLHSH